MYKNHISPLHNFRVITLSYFSNLNFVRSTELVFLQEAFIISTDSLVSLITFVKISLIVD